MGDHLFALVGPSGVASTLSVTRPLYSQA
jgi:hypothetical protein